MPTKEQIEAQKILLAKREKIAATSTSSTDAPEKAPLSQTEKPADRKCKRCPTMIEARHIPFMGKWIQPDLCDACIRAEDEAEAAKKERERQQAREQEKRDRAANIEQCMRAAGIGRKHAGAALTQYKFVPEPVNAMLNRWSGATPGVYLTGPRGTGKTHMAAAIVRDRLLNLWTAKMITVIDLLLEIKECFGPNPVFTQGQIIKDYTEIPFLVLDDIGAEKPSEFVLETLYVIIDRRYREERPTVITSNLSIAELEQRLDGRIASRISEMCAVVAFGGRDRRIKQ